MAAGDSHFGSALERRFAMSEILFFGACLAACFALAMNRARTSAWAFSVAVATFLFQQGVAGGSFEPLPLTFWTLLAWLPLLVL